MLRLFVLNAFPAVLRLCYRLITYCINYKLAILTYKVLHSAEPGYLSSGLLVILFIHTFGARGFSVAAPKV